MEEEIDKDKLRYELRKIMQSKNKEPKKKEKKKEGCSEFEKGMWFGTFATGFVFIMSAIAGGWDQKLPWLIPQIAQVQETYVIPEKLEIKCENLDRDSLSLPETYVKYNGNSYLFKIDENKRPICIPYKIRTEIIEK